MAGEKKKPETQSDDVQGEVEALAGWRSALVVLPLLEERHQLASVSRALRCLPRGQPRRLTGTLPIVDLRHAFELTGLRAASTNPSKIGLNSPVR